MPRARASRLLVVASVAVALLAAACAGAPAPVASGGRVSVLGSWDGRELDAFKAMLRPFEKRTGITIDYTGSRDLEGTLDRSFSVGDAPDVVGLAGPSHLARLAGTGTLKQLDDVIDLGSYKSQTAPAFVDLGTVDDHLMGVFIKATVKGLMWYDPAVYKPSGATTWSDLLISARGVAANASEVTRPWCLGLESGATSGWPGTDWIEDFLLRQSGVEAYDAWVKGTLPWNSDPVRQAFLAYGQVASDGAIYGGSRSAIRTYFGDAGAGLFTNPPGCVFLHQGSFMSSFFSESHIDDARYDFLPFPEVGTQFTGSVIGAGDLVGLVHDTPAARQLMRYLVSVEAQQLFVDQGGALSGNLQVDHYPDRVSYKAAQVLIAAKRFRFDASDSMPGQMSDAFLQAVLDFTRDPSGLDALLDHLDVVQGKAYASK